MVKLLDSQPRNLRQNVAVKVPCRPQLDLCTFSELCRCFPRLWDHRDEFAKVNFLSSACVVQGSPQDALHHTTQPNATWSCYWEPRLAVGDTQLRLFIPSLGILTRIILEHSGNSPLNQVSIGLPSAPSSSHLFLHSLPSSHFTPKSVTRLLVLAFQQV